jgi:hypothetical protein
MCQPGYTVVAGGCVVAQKSCLSILQANGSAASGVYALDPDGDGVGFFAYCDMTNDGGGWMKILQYHDAPYTPSAGAVGNIAVADTAAMAKLDDASVNSLGSLSVYREYRLQGGETPKKLFIKSSAVWDDTARGEGLALKAPVLACEDLTNCAYTVVTPAPGRPSIDTNGWSPSTTDNDETRYFTDYGNNPECYGVTDSQRCYNAGVSTGHTIIPDLSIWTREVPAARDGLVVFPLDETTGTAVHDATGDGFDASVITGSWTTGHLGGALLGSMRTLDALPVNDAVTVSVWVRRDGNGVGYPRILSWNADGLDLADAASGDKLAVYTSVLGWQTIGTSFGTGFHHVAVTGGGGALTVYFDGAQVYTTPLALNLNGQMSIGTRWDGVESWNGAFDQVRVYDRVLTAAEILKLSQE